MKNYRFFLAVYVLTLLNLIFASRVLGQEFRMVNYSVSEGLPSSEVYCILQDRQGYMWFGTDRGAVRYDGYRFQVFTTADGMPDNTVFEIQEDTQGRIWFATYSPRLCHYENGKISPYKFNSEIDKKNYPNTPKLDFYIDGKNQVFLGCKHLGLIKISSTGELKRIASDNKTIIFKQDSSFLVSNGNEKFSGNNKQPSLSSGINDFQIIIEMGDGTWQPVSVEPSGGHYTSKAVVVKEGNYYFGIGKKLFVYRNYRLAATYILPHVLSYIYLDRFSQLWLCYLNHGVEVMNLTNHQVRALRFPQLANYSVSAAYCDREGGFWLSTLQHGVFYLPSLDFSFLPFSDALTAKEVRSLVCMNDTLAFISLANEGVYSVSMGKHSRWQTTRLYPSKVSPKLCWDSENRVLVSAAQSFQLYKPGGKPNFIPGRIKGGTKSMIRRRDGSFWTGGRLGLTWLKDGVYRDTTYAKAKIWALLEDQDSSLWLGTLTGLRKVDRQGRLLPQAKHSVLQKRVSALDQLPDGRLVVGTLGAGLLVVDGDSILQIGTGLGLNTNLVNCVAIDSGGRIWVGSGRGLNRVVVNHLEPPKVESLNRGNGLPFQEVQQIDIHGNKVWLAGPQGLSVIDQNAWHKRSVLPPIHLLRIGINGRDTLPLAKVEVSHRQNYLSFSFLGLRFRRNGPLNYRYRLGGLDHDWRYTQDTTVSYPALPPGTYTFEVAAQNEAGEWSIPAAKAVILVLKPYWQKWWFIMLVILAMLVLGVGITYYFIRQGRNRLHREKNLEKWKMKALRARMDPHFIFNTLNTIQAYISTHDTIAAEKYLNKFARLVRKVMHQSSEETISLADEREMLELYLALEEMRFSGIFTYKIHWDPALNADLVQIPGMLVQPFVENAILHGLLPKKKGGKVVITFKAAGSHIFCTIEDDGIGRVAARKLNRAQHKLHKSAGLDLVRSRLKLLTSSKNTAPEIIITDLYHADQTAAGTHIAFYIPILNSN